MPRIDPSRGVSMDAAREVKWDLRRNLFFENPISFYIKLPINRPGGHYVLLDMGSAAWVEPYSINSCPILV